MAKGCIVARVLPLISYFYFPTIPKNFCFCYSSYLLSLKYSVLNTPKQQYFMLLTSGTVNFDYHKPLNILTYSGYPLKFYFQIPCVFPVRPQIFPVPIYVICDYYIHKTNWQTYPPSKINWKFLEIFAAKI